MSADDAMQNYAEAKRLFRQGQYAEALALVDDLDQQFPNEQNIMYARAECLVALGRSDEAGPVCMYLRDVLGHQRAGKLFDKIEAATTATMAAFDIPSSTPKYPSIVAYERSGLNKIAWGGGAVAVVGLVLSAWFFFNGSASNPNVAEAVVRLAKAKALPLPDNPTFHKDVAPILNENCVTCHRPGEAVPMSLMSYAQARPWAKSIRKMVEARLMPPWHADPSVGEWKNDRRLSERDMTTILRWIDQGTHAGNPDDAPPMPIIVEGWKIGEPDVVFAAPSEVLSADLEDEYRYVYIPTRFKQDRWIEAAEIRPGNIDVVHHVIVFTADPSKGTSGLSASLGGFAPGSPPLVMGKGRGIKIKANSVLVLQIHYHKEPGTTEYDHTSVGLRFARDTVKKEFRFGTIGTEKFVIPAGVPNYPVEATFTLKENIHLEQIVPHMHLRGKNMKVWAILPDGHTEHLISVPKYDFNWQTFYELAEPISLPRGTELHARAVYDNSTDNPFNPNPYEDVRWGQPTTAEMMYAFYMYTVDEEDLSLKDPGA